MLFSILISVVLTPQSFGYGGGGGGGKEPDPRVCGIFGWPKESLKS